MTIRTGMIISTVESNKHTTGNTQRIVTDVVNGWCGVDLVERVTFDLNTAGTLTVNVEDAVYKIKGVRKSVLIDTLKRFLTMNITDMQKYRIK